MRAATALAGALLALAACSDRAAPAKAAPPLPPPGFHPDAFPDLPFPWRFQAAPDRDQLAVAYAGGTVRRLDVLLRSSPTGAAPEKVMGDDLAPRLGDAGWARIIDGDKPIRPEDLVQRWRKGGEVLVVAAERFEGGSQVAMRLERDPR